MESYGIKLCLPSLVQCYVKRSVSFWHIIIVCSLALLYNIPLPEPTYILSKAADNLVHEFW